MMFIKLCLYFLTFLSVEQDDKSKKGAKDDIEVIGIARPRKAGAAVLSLKDSVVYFLDGISYWKSDVVYKKIKVSGKLVIEHHEESKEIIQQMVGEVRIIKNPKWELVK